MKALAEYCAFLQREPGTGEIATVFDQFQNINQIKTRGIEFELSYALDLARGGSLDFRGLANYVIGLITVDSAGTINRAGMTGVPVSQTPGIPDWVAAVLLAYDYDPLAITLQAHYIAEGKYDVTLIGPDDPRYNISLPNSINDNTSDDNLILNLNLRYNLEGVSELETQLFFGINNLLDQDPPLASSSQGYTNGVLFDQVGRTYRAGFRIQM